MDAVKLSMEPAPAQPRSSRRRALWIVLGTIGLVLLSAGGIFLDAWVSAGKVIEQEKKRVAERTEQFRAERGSFLNLFEPAEEGNAWEPFLEAMKELDSFTGTDLDVFPSLAGDEIPRIDDEALELMLVRLKPVLAHLERAFRRREVEPRSAYDDLWNQAVPEIADSIKLNRMIADLAAHCHRLGNDREALNLLAIGYWSGGVQCAKGNLLNELVRIVLNGMHREPLKKLIQEHECTSSDLQFFGKALDRLDRSLPPLSRVLHRDDLMARQLYLKLVRDEKLPDDKGIFATPKLRGYRRFLPVRVQVAQWFRWKDGLENEFDRIEQLPPWDRPPAAVKAFETALDEPIPLMTDSLARAFRNWLLNRRDMTLARVAVALAAHEVEKGVYPSTLNDLAPNFIERMPLDPWNGKSFRYINGGASATLYSLGGDGDDDGGRPVSDDAMDDEDGDVVWIVKRREAAPK